MDLVATVINAAVVAAVGLLLAWLVRGGFDAPEMQWAGGWLGCWISGLEDLDDGVHNIFEF